MQLTAEMLGRAAPTATKVVSVRVPEFGPGTIAYLGEMSATERDERIEIAWLEHCQAHGKDAEKGVGFRAWAVAASLCDPQRKWLAADAAAIASLAGPLGTAPTNVVTRCFLQVKQLQGLTKDDVEALEKNLPAAVAASSGSPSASASAPSAS